MTSTPVTPDPATGSATGAATGPVEITVRGHARRRQAPELATVLVEAAADGEDRDAVLAQVTRACAAVAQDLGRLGDVVTAWSADQVQVWSSTPVDSLDRPIRQQHHASALTRATFRADAAVGSLVQSLLRHRDIRVQGLTWELSDPTHTALLDTVHTEAVADAVARAGRYAAALGLGEVRCVAVADEGLLGAGPTGGGGGMMLAKARFADHGPDGGLVFTPAEIEVAGTVDARFSAR